MGNILVTGSAGQIGSELVPALRDLYGDNAVVAGWNRTPLPDEISAGPNVALDVTDFDAINKIVKNFDITSIFHMSSILSATAEAYRNTAHDVNINGTVNILESAYQNGIDKVILPSSIAAFGTKTPNAMTPNDTIQNPDTVYGISKVFGELIGNYYDSKLGLDVRGVRLPGVISWKTEPTAGTTDYAVAMFYEAIKKDSYECYLSPDTSLPMMYMPDAINSLIMLYQADYEDLMHHSDFNVHAMTFTPRELATEVTRINPKFEIYYKVDPVRQSIADSWPSSLDDSAARNEWDWKPHYSLRELAEDMYKNLVVKLS
ncbi:MAG: NAD-dependent epimerase/dehydratase family protein [Chloroflexota bacterium]|nr:NAD-dependent epimerase/dehydratase family protein [Chloroflexota bacterium]